MLLSKDSVVENIAKNFLGIDTLKTQNNDNLDFHDLSVWQIKSALEMSYLSGQSNMIEVYSNSKNSK